MTGKLIIARHHESEWNKLGLWTGWHDSHLTEYGFEKSAEMGDLLQGMHIDQVFASMEVRTIETLSCMLNEMKLERVPATHSAALNERDYGEYTGKNKWDMEKLVGKETFDHIRRDWDYPVPGGETLKMVSERVVPYFLSEILPLIKDGKNVLVVAHGNSLRALMKYLESSPDEDISKLEMLFGAIVIYDLDQDGHMLTKEVRQVTSDVKA